MTPPERRFAAAPRIFADLTARAGNGSLVTYAEFARANDLGAPIGLSWVLMPLLRWCEARRLPPLPIIVVRRRDRRPSGPYAQELIAADTARVFGHRWALVPPPAPSELAAEAPLRLPRSLAP